VHIEPFSGLSRQIVVQFFASESINLEKQKPQIARQNREKKSLPIQNSL